MDVATSRQLREIVALKEKYGAWLMVDEAHATGLYGTERRGLAEEFDVASKSEIQMGTLGKAFGSAGGYICGSRVLIDSLINRARPFIFTTALSASPSKRRRPAAGNVRPKSASRANNVAINFGPT